MQYKKGGVGQSVTPNEIKKESKLSPTVIYHHINSLMKRELLKKVKRGHYCLNWTESLVAVSLSTVTYWDMLQWNTERGEFIHQFKAKGKRKK
jgi:predicted transcriptional regulator